VPEEVTESQWHFTFNDETHAADQSPATQVQLNTEHERCANSLKVKVPHIGVIGLLLYLSQVSGAASFSS